MTTVATIPMTMATTTMTTTTTPTTHARARQPRRKCTIERAFAGGGGQGVITTPLLPSIFYFSDPATGPGISYM